MAESPALDTCQLRQVTKTGAWLSMLPSTVNRTEMGDQDWRYVLFICYGIYPLYLSPHCDGCNVKFSICCALYCKKGGFIITCHNKLFVGVANLEGKAFTPLHVCDNPLIHPGHAVLEVKVHPVVSPYNNLAVATETSEQKGDLVILNLW